MWYTFTSGAACVLIACSAVRAAEEKPTRRQRIRIGEINKLDYKGQTWYFYIPTKVKRDRRRSLPLLVSIHGGPDRKTDNIEGCVKTFMDFSERDRVAVIAPFFLQVCRGYQTLCLNGTRADLRLLEILEEAKRRVPILHIKRFYIFGHSAGAQFTQRFALVHPERVAKGAVSCGAYTLPDPAEPWPRGTREARIKLPELKFDEFVQLHFAIVVGELDGEDDHNTVKGSEALYSACKGYAKKRRLRCNIVYHVNRGVGHACAGMSARWAITNLFERR